MQPTVPVTSNFVVTDLTCFGPSDTLDCTCTVLAQLHFALVQGSCQGCIEWTREDECCVQLKVYVPSQTGQLDLTLLAVNDTGLLPANGGW